MDSWARYTVSGRVQGVFFRASTLAQAQRFGLRGWVRNRADGSVEVLAGGPAHRLDEFERWLWQGPELARVDQVIVAREEPLDTANFEIR